MPLLTYHQYLRHAGQFVCKASAAQAGSFAVQFSANNQVEAEFDGLTRDQLEQLAKAVADFLQTLPPKPGSAQPVASGS